MKFFLKNVKILRILKCSLKSAFLIVFKILIFLNITFFCILPIQSKYAIFKKVEQKMKNNIDLHNGQRSRLLELIFSEPL